MIPRKFLNKLVKPVVYFILALFLISTAAPTVSYLISPESKNASSSYMR